MMFGHQMGCPKNAKNYHFFWDHFDLKKEKWKTKFSIMIFAERTKYWGQKSVPGFILLYLSGLSQDKLGCQDQLSSLKDQLSTVNYQVSKVKYQVSKVKYQLFSINYQASSFKNQLSNIYYKVSTIKSSTNDQVHNEGTHPQCHQMNAHTQGGGHTNSVTKTMNT